MQRLRRSQARFCALLAFVLPACGPSHDAPEPDPPVVSLARPEEGSALPRERDVEPGPIPTMAPEPMTDAELPLDALLSELESPDPFVREEAVYDLDPEGEALDALAAVAADDPEADVRRAAIVQLGSAEDPAVVPALTRALEDPDPGVVEEALLALQELGGARTLARLEPLLRHGDPEVRELARETIEAIR